MVETHKKRIGGIGVSLTILAIILIGLSGYLYYQLSSLNAIHESYVSTHSHTDTEYNLLNDTFQNYKTTHNYSNSQYNEILTKLAEISYTVNILIEYNNRTKAWHNQTIIATGWSLFNATLKITDENVKYYYSSGSPIVTEINNVKATDSYWWFYYLWDTASSTWKFKGTGADDYTLKNQDIVAWYLADTSNYPNIPTP